MKNVLEYLENVAINSENEIIDENKRCSYKELYINSRKAATSLSKLYNRKQPVAVFMQKGVDCLTTFFSSVYAGCFYCLLNTDLPSSRLNTIMEVLETKTVITNYDNFDKASEYFCDKQIILIEDLLKSSINEKLLENRRSKAKDIDPLYVQFTSGSTGVPKGVVVSHRSVIDFINIFTSNFNITSKDVIANQAPFDFDVSVKDIYSALATGASLVIVPKHLFSTPAPLLDFICEYNVTTMIWAVSALCLISTFHGLEYRVPSKVSKVLFSGEVMPIKHLNNWMEHLPNATFVNLYGPTEITCNCTYHIIDRNRDYKGKIPIGNVFDNEEIFLLDDNNCLITDDNIVGQICVSGTCLALGYYNNKEQTNSHFIQNPLNHYYQETIYLTGDLGYMENGELYFSGRKDFQIKYRGHRIELEEVDKAIGELEEIERVCCLFDSNKSQLLAFYVGNKEKKEVFSKIKENLPAFMIPSRIIKVEAFPLTKNGKIDRKLLMTMGGRKHGRQKNI